MPDNAVTPGSPGKAIASLSPVKTGKGTLAGRIGRLREFIATRILRRQHHPSHSYRYFCKELAQNYKVDGQALTVAVSAVEVRPADVGDVVLFLAYTLRHELDARVLVVDSAFSAGDNSLSRRLAADGQDGYFQVMAGVSPDYRSLVLPTAIDGVMFLPSGERSGVRSLPQKSDTMGLFLKEACTEYDFLLFMQGDVMTDTRYMSLAENVQLNLLLAEENRTLASSLRDRELLYTANGIDRLRFVLLPP